MAEGVGKGSVSTCWKTDVEVFIPGLAQLKFQLWQQKTVSAGSVNGSQCIFKSKEPHCLFPQLGWLRTAFRGFGTDLRRV